MCHTESSEVDHYCKSSLSPSLHLPASSKSPAITTGPASTSPCSVRHNTLSSCKKARIARNSELQSSVCFFYVANMIVITAYSVPLFFMGLTFWTLASKAGTVNTAAASKHVEYHCFPIMSYFSVSFRFLYLFY